MGLWLMRHFDDIESDAFDFFYLGTASEDNWTEKLSNCVCSLFFVWVLVLISAFLGFCLLWALAPILLILVGTPRSCGFGQRRICLSSLCSNTYYWEWTRPGDQDRSYLLWRSEHIFMIGLGVEIILVEIILHVQCDIQLQSLDEKQAFFFSLVPLSLSV